jgi:hypothetical protein
MDLLPSEENNMDNARIDKRIQSLIQSGPCAVVFYIEAITEGLKSKKIKRLKISKTRFIDDRKFSLSVGNFITGKSKKPVLVMMTEDEDSANSLDLFTKARFPLLDGREIIEMNEEVSAFFRKIRRYISVNKYELTSE